MKVIVTSGGTREPIDRVRFITNVSTGRTGARIAEELARAGHCVLYLHAEGAVMPVASETPIDARTFRTFEDLEALLRESLRDFAPAAVIQAAAISDFKVEAPGEGKLPSGAPVTLRLLPREKLVHELKRWRAGPLQVIAFKLTDSRDRAVIDGKLRALASGGDTVDWIVHNDLGDRADDLARAFTLYATGPELRVVDTFSDPAALARGIRHLLTPESRS